MTNKAKTTSAYSCINKKNGTLTVVGWSTVSLEEAFVSATEELVVKAPSGKILDTVEHDTEVDGKNIVMVIITAKITPLVAKTMGAFSSKNEKFGKLTIIGWSTSSKMEAFLSATKQLVEKDPSGKVTDTLEHHREIAGKHVVMVIITANVPK